MLLWEGKRRQHGTSGDEDRSTIHPNQVQEWMHTEWVPPTSNNAEELFNAHAGIDAVEEPLDVAPPAPQGAASFWRGACQGTILQKNPAEPANHFLNPLQKEREGTEMVNTTAGRTTTSHTYPITRAATTASRNEQLAKDSITSSCSPNAPWPGL